MLMETKHCGGRSDRAPSADSQLMAFRHEWFWQPMDTGADGSCSKNCGPAAPRCGSCDLIMKWIVIVRYPAEVALRLAKPGLDINEVSPRCHLSSFEIHRHAPEALRRIRERRCHGAVHVPAACRNVLEPPSSIPREPGVFPERAPGARRRLRSLRQVARFDSPEALRRILEADTPAVATRTLAGATAPREPLP